MSLPYSTSQHTGPGPWDAIGPELDSPPGEASTTAPYGTDNSQAVPINQRSPRHWSGHTLAVDGRETTRLLPSQKGRKSFLVLVPATTPSGATTPAGVYIDEQVSVLNAEGGPQGFLLPVGASVAIDTEGGLFAISATPGTDTFVSVITAWD